MKITNIPSRKQILPCYLFAFPYLSSTSPGNSVTIISILGFGASRTSLHNQIQIGLLLTKSAVKNKNTRWLISNVYIARCWQTSKWCTVSDCSVKDIQGQPFQQVKIHNLLQWKRLQESWSPASPHFKSKNLYTCCYMLKATLLQISQAS